MKNLKLIAILISAFVAAGNALAQQHEVRADVPFNFTIGNKTLPAGNYSIGRVSDSAIQIRNTDTHAALLTQASDESNRSSQGGELVFNKVAGHYFLNEILCESVAMNVKLPSTKKQQRDVMQEAKLRGDTGVVLIAAR